MAWAILGIASGLSWWSSQIATMVLLPGVVLIAARPRILRRAGPYVALGLFFLASWPFWVWNARHEWATFRHLAMWGGPLPPWSIRFQIVGETLLESLRDYFWDGRAVRLSSWAWILSWITVLGVYVPGLLVALARAAVWAKRLRRRERPWQDALDLVVVAFWATVAAHLLTWFGTSTVLRYAMTFQATLPVLCAMALARLAAVGGTSIAGLLAAALLGFNLVTHIAFVTDGSAEPRRPVDAVVARLEALGIRSCYAEGNAAQVITFESSERVLCTDYIGYRNYAFLRTVDGVDDPSAVAIVTHRALRRPHPDVMAEALTSPAPGTSGRTSATTRSSTASWSRLPSGRSPRRDGSRGPRPGPAPRDWLSTAACGPGGPPPSGQASGSSWTSGRHTRSRN